MTWSMLVMNNGMQKMDLLIKPVATLTQQNMQTNVQALSERNFSIYRL